MMRQPSHRLFVIAFAGLLSFATRIADAFSARLDSLQLKIKNLYRSGSYDRAAELLRAPS